MGLSYRVAGLVLVVLTGLSRVSTPADGEAAPAEQLARLTSATVILKLDRMYRGEKIPTQGTGFFLDAKGTIVTNWHVVAPQVEVNIDGIRTETSTGTGDFMVAIEPGTRQERSVRGKVLALDRRRDLALVRVPGPSPAWLAIGDMPLKVADQIWVAGFPFGDFLARNSRSAEMTLTTGRVTSIRHDEAGAEDAIQIDAAVNPGNSGCPLLNGSTEVVGVVNAGVTNANLTSFAIPLAKLKQFIANNQFGVAVEPNAVYSRSTPLQVRVFPILLSLDGLTCELVLAGGDIPEQRLGLNRQGSEFLGELRMPARNAELSGVSAEYRLTVRLARAGAGAAVERDVTLPVREDQSAQLRSDRDPTDMMRDRKVYGNRTEVTYVPIGLGDQVAPETQAKKRAALNELAKNVKLKKDAEGKVVLQNDQLSTCRFSARPENYARLGLEKHRNLAASFDEKECQFLALRSEQQNERQAARGPSYDRYRRDERRRELWGQASTLKGELADLQIRIREAGLCRCPSGQWSQTNYETCQPCLAVSVPE